MPGEANLLSEWVKFKAKKPWWAKRKIKKIGAPKKPVFRWRGL
jgi:hypothetical protein